mgnify:CR=1 FL=1
MVLTCLGSQSQSDVVVNHILILDEETPRDLVAPATIPQSRGVELSMTGSLVMRFLNADPQYSKMHRIGIPMCAPCRLHQSMTRSKSGYTQVSHSIAIARYFGTINLS